MNPESVAEIALDQGRGILRLAPSWVPRSFCVPGRRIKLHPDDSTSDPIVMLKHFGPDNPDLAIQPELGRIVESSEKRKAS